MITVDYALDQGKDVYVYKSKNINNKYFEGNKLLIEEGAKTFEVDLLTGNLTKNLKKQ